MKKIIFIIICVSSLSFTQTFDYLPAKVGNHQILTYSQFTLSYNEDNEQADWVAYELTGDEVKIKRQRCDCFSADTNVINGSADKKDYENSGFDRGHLSPSADNKATKQSNRESFLFSNMSPQLPGFNRGIWEKLEEWVRGEALRYNKIYVVTGPVFINDLGTIGKDSVTIPGYFFKAILRFEGDTARTIGFLLPQIGATGNIQDYMVTVNTIETLTELDFFPKLDDSIENKAEGEFKAKDWGF